MVRREAAIDDDINSQTQSDMIVVKRLRKRKKGALSIRGVVAPGARLLPPVTDCQQANQPFSHETIEN